ncbi:MAG TPA: prolipoprotein diacylglyceryl transferase [Steroidobacteraceae bacterium]|nr:prolipoprotein diacylglyceryl transferase [Steroidobacteraceae bacterium]
MLTYPDIDPVAFAIGPVKVHWYGLMYVFGFVAGWWLARRRAADPRSTWKAADVDDLIFFAAIGVIAGGRLGWILVYGFDVLREDPFAILRVWEGGMSFHGGLVGVMAAIALFAYRRGRRVADVFDFTAPLPAVGLFAGRIGNFINSELWGKPTDLPWGVLVDGRALHPSQLYEAALEGIVLFAILWWFTSKPRPRLAPAGLVLILYAVFRIAVEFVRVPDAHLDYLAFGWLTMGQLLSLPVLAVGLAMFGWSQFRRQPSGNYV